ncbi:MAG: hypothetical protein RLZZ398_734 [Verrucomicrobiota bacterium]
MAAARMGKDEGGGMSFMASGHPSTCGQSFQKHFKPERLLVLRPEVGGLHLWVRLHLGRRAFDENFSGFQNVGIRRDIEC